jgi:2-aminoethylphosphonate-pyruvate transaminase
MERTVLLNPGPVTLSERVRRALLRPDMCHREADFTALMADLRGRVERVYPAHDHRAVLLSGSGTAAVEAMLATLAPREKTTVVLANGVYGERMAAMLEAHGKPVQLLKGDWLQPLDLEAAERALADRAVGAVATVHHETTTGRINDVQAVAGLCERRGLPLLLDAVSSYGGEALEIGRFEAVAATANKCLHGVPGVAFVLVRPGALRREEGPRSVYLDLRRYVQGDEAPFTMAVQSCFALHEALQEMEEAGGWTARRARYRTISEAVRKRLLPVEPLVEVDARASMLTAWPLPERVSYHALHDRLRAAGFVIYAGQGALAGRIFRIATMGDIHDADLARLLEALAS